MNTKENKNEGNKTPRILTKEEADKLKKSIEKKIKNNRVILK